MRYVKDKRLACRTIDGTVYIVSPWDHHLHKLNQTASEIWGLIEKGLEKDEIIRYMIDTYEVVPEAAQKDIDEIIAHLLHKGLIHYDATPVTGS